MDQDLYVKHKGKGDKLVEKNENLEIEIKNIKDFNKDMEGSDHKKMLRDYVLNQKPNMLVISWCYSINGDVCMALRRNGTLSRMVLEAEMREIGIASERSKLHPKQKEVLKSAQDPKWKVITLAGGTGSGKTILAAEVVKIWMAQHFEDQSSVSHNFDRLINIDQR